MTYDDASKTRRVRLEVRGRVQGVGFRPTVYRVATDMGLGGFVGNDVHGAFIELEGAAATVAEFADRLMAALPPLAEVAEARENELTPVGEGTFRIEASSSAGEQDAEISPDVGTCVDCLREMRDPTDRRYGYPFINCTNCGPRYSIVQGIPYDRVNTTMSVFPMCPACQTEYDDPTNRRFHAQPNACPVCGPRVWFADSAGREMAGDGIAQCVERLRSGGVVAVKGLGGFHLVCRADLDESVATLRERKAREAKPFALMVASLEAAREIAEVDNTAAEALTSWRRPILLLPKKVGAKVSESVASGTDCLGVMLPYTPVHYLLFDQGLGPLVMTSANPTDEPLCSDNDEAVRRLSDIVDGSLMHNRDIARRVDDSVIAAVPRTGRPSEACGSRGVRGLQPHATDSAVSRSRGPAVPRSCGPPVLQSSGPPVPRSSLVPLRRSRGYVPEPVRVAGLDAPPLLAAGGDLKGVVCLAKGGQAVLSEHLGELANPAAFRNFVAAIDRLKVLLRVEPEAVAHDMHPGYVSSRHAKTLGLRTVPVQHHHAHIVSCMAEHGLAGPVIGLAADGTGYGTDGAIWGCELMVCDARSFRRLRHLEYFPLAGGDAAAREPWRPAVALLRQAFGDDWQKDASFVAEAVDPVALRLLEQRLERGTSVPMTSSLGRLFDAVACILGICQRNRFEAEAAMALEASASSVDAGDWGTSSVGLPLRSCPEQAGSVLRTVQPANSPFPAGGSDTDLGLQGQATFGVSGIIRGLVWSVRDGTPVPELALGFHQALAAMFADTILQAADAEGLGQVVLSGGCFLNKLLLRLLVNRLEETDLEVYIHSRVPTGDGGLALGQAVIAAEQLKG